MRFKVIKSDIVYSNTISSGYVAIEWLGDLEDFEVFLQDELEEVLAHADTCETLTDIDVEKNGHVAMVCFTLEREREYDKYMEVLTAYENPAKSE